MLDHLRRLSVKPAFSVLCLATCATISLAQNDTPAAKPGAPTKDPVASSLRLQLQRAQNNIVGAVEAMPADKFSYKPTADQITFAHLAAHIVTFNNALCAKAADVPAPKVDEPKDTDTKDQLLA